MNSLSPIMHADDDEESLIAEIVMSEKLFAS
jgi:hypothetical protein